MRPFNSLSLATILLINTVGCSENDPNRVHVSGSVTYQGEPVGDGFIRFMPKLGTKAPSSGGFIIDGKYTIDAKGGVPHGTHQVWIEAYRPDPRYQNGEELPDGFMDADELKEQYLPEQFNRKSELEITIAPDSEPIEKDFHLTSD